MPLEASSAGSAGMKPLRPLDHFGSLLQVRGHMVVLEGLVESTTQLSPPLLCGRSFGSRRGMLCVFVKRMPCVLSTFAMSRPDSPR